MKLFFLLRHRPEKRGFTLLLAALVSSIALSLGAAIFSLAQKEIVLASLSKSSQFAFYAADTAAECALYWDVRNDYFASTTPAIAAPTCDGVTLPFSTTNGAVVPPLSDQTYPYTVFFEFDVFQNLAQSQLGYCVDVTIQKSLDATNAIKTIIHADGYSTPCATRLTSNQALQRSVELNY